jgi:hypothetical protein
MNLDGLADAYTLSPLTVSPTELLLDPSNPRLVTEFSQDRQYSTAEIRSPGVQRYVHDLVCRKEHEVKRLIASMREMGFVGGIHEMIVKSVGGRNGPYLVIEGNRRTAALRYLFDQANDLRPDVRKSIERIEVKLFTYRTNRAHDEQKVIDVILGSIHIDGPKEWGALERAHYVHRSYSRLLGNQKFRYETNLSREVGTTFNLGPKAVHSCLIICRVYEQLRRAQVGVEPKHYTLIELATKTRAIAETYFELNRGLCELSDIGIERFAELMLGQDAPIHNPKLFNALVEVYTDGTPLELEQVISRERAPDDVCVAIRRRRARQEFRENLEAIKEQIGSLYVDDFRNTEGEKALIRRIRDLVEKRLVPLMER